jgi:hypothetical protein
MNHTLTDYEVQSLIEAAVHPLQQEIRMQDNEIDRLRQEVRALERDLIQLDLDFWRTQQK